MRQSSAIVAVVANTVLNAIGLPLWLATLVPCLVLNLIVIFTCSLCRCSQLHPPIKIRLGDTDSGLLGPQFFMLCLRRRRQAGGSFGGVELNIMLASGRVLIPLSSSFSSLEIFICFARLFRKLFSF